MKMELLCDDNSTFFMFQVKKTNKFYYSVTTGEVVYVSDDGAVVIFRNDSISIVNRGNCANKLLRNLSKNEYMKIQFGD